MKNFSLKRNLLTTASVLALGIAGGYSQKAEAAALAATGNATNGGFTLNGDLSLAQDVVNTGTATADIVTLGNNAASSTLTITNTFGLTTSGSGDAVATTGTPTSANVAINDGGEVITSSTGLAFNIDHSIGTITNLGNIEGTNANTNVIDLATGISASIVNGNEAGTDVATITAAGTGEAIVVAGTLTGNILNYTGSLIEGGASDAGLIDVNGIVTGSITNAGSITVSGAGIALDLGANVTGGVSNSGAITAVTLTGVNVSASTIGDITNTGTIQANSGWGINIDNTANVTLITNSGLINDQSDGIGIEIAGTSNATAINNSGTISATTTGSAIVVDGALTSTNSNGTIYNTGTMSAAASTGGVIDIDADITNSTTALNGIVNTGSIADSGNGSAINIGGAVGISNSGTITAAGATDTILQSAANGNAAGINNSGTISNTSTGSAIDIGTGAMTGTIVNSGAITGAGGDVIDIGANVTGGISNSGTIQSTTGNVSAIDVTASATAAITNSGTASSITVDGTEAAINVATGQTLTGAITNAGSITNTNTTASAAHAIFVDGVLATGIVNTGTISTTATGAAAAIRVDSVTAGGIANNGGLISTTGSAGAILLGADNDIVGDITNSGTIQSTNATPVAIDLSAGASQDVTVTNTGTITGQVALGAGDVYTQTAGSVSNSGATVILGSTDAETINIDGGTITGNIDMGSDNGDAINFGDGTSDTITIAGTVDYDDMTAEFGTTTLTGVATGIAGSTITVNSGATLYIQSDSSNAAATTIGGTLQIKSGNTLTAGTTVALNDTLTIDVTTAADGTATYGKISGSGAITYAASGAIEINHSGSGYQAATTLDKAVDMGGARAGNYVASKALTDNSYVLAFTQESDGTDDIDIAITRANTYDSASSRANESAVGAVLETIGAAGTTDANLRAIMGALDSDSSATDVESGLEVLTPEVNGAVTSGAVTVSNEVIGTTAQRLASLRASESGIATGGDYRDIGLWGEVFGSAVDQGDRDNIRGYQADVYGGTIGIDTEITDNIRLGIAGSYANSDIDSARGDAEIDTFQGTLYGSYEDGARWYDVQAGVAFNDYETKRNVVVGSTSDQARGENDGMSYTLKGTAGYDMKVQGPLQFTPLASLQYTFLNQDDYTETGSTGNLTVDSEDINIFEAGLGFKLAYPLSYQGVSYLPELRFTYLYDFVGDEHETTSRFTGASNTFVSTGADVAQSTFEFGLGLDILAQDNVTVSLDYDLTEREDFQSHSGSLKARLAF